MDESKPSPISEFLRRAGDIEVERYERLPQLAAVGRLLDSRRREQGLSLDDLLSRGQVTKDSLANLDRGLKQSNSASIVRSVAAVLGLPAEKVVEAAGVGDREDTELAHEAIRCVGLIEDPLPLSPEQREALHEFIGILSGT
jgi:transcriptional regulator with XRE-family HTH domain